MINVVRSVAIAAAVLALVLRAAADETADTNAWFKSLMQPGTNRSCCDIADCHRVQADWHDGTWWALIDDQWQRVEPSRVLKQDSIFADAVACTVKPVSNIGAESLILCFVPPFNGT